MSLRLSILCFFNLIVGVTSAQKNFAVVELFTSECCVSCPSGDKTLSTLSAEATKSGQPVYCLEYHVDYWNKGAWKDPFSKNQFTFRQENYTRVLPQKEVYTPQLVFNGSSEVLATNLVSARQHVEKALAEPAALSLKFQVDSVRRDTAFISYTTSKTDKNFVLRIAFTESKLFSKVTSGENAGKTLQHDCVVRIFSSVENPQMKGTTTIPMKGLKPGPNTTWIAFVQHKQTMRILGADRR